MSEQIEESQGQPVLTPEQMISLNEMSGGNSNQEIDRPTPTDEETKRERAAIRRIYRVVSNPHGNPSDDVEKANRERMRELLTRGVRLLQRPLGERTSEAQ